MERFNKLSLSIRNLMPEIAMHHLISAPRPKKFTDSLIKKPTKNLDELRNREPNSCKLRIYVTFAKTLELTMEEIRERRKTEVSDIYSVGTTNLKIVEVLDSILIPH